MKNSSGAYAAAVRYGWIDEICTHMIVKRKKTGYWTFEKCLDEAKKYNRRSDFSNLSRSAYNRAKINNWLDDICNHMIANNSKPNGYWNFEYCKELFDLCSDKIDFKKNYPNAYESSYRKGWLKLFIE